MSKIEWLARPGTIPASWSPIQDVIKGPSGRGYHCTKCSPGCEHCWAESMNKRFGNGLPFDDRPVEFELMQDVLEKPLHWRKPRTVAVQLMGDFMHRAISSAFQFQVLHMIGQCPKHTFLILTKRAEQLAFWEEVCGWTPYPNLWLGVTVCNQEEADEKIPRLLQIPAAVHFVSIEPMLGPIRLTALGDGSWYDREGADQYDALCGLAYWGTDGDVGLGGGPHLDWVILGGESGPKARPMHPDWVRQIQIECHLAHVPFFFKAWGEWKPEDRGGGFGNIHMWDDGSFSYKSGKARAGHLLDGKEYHEWPK